MNSPLRQKLSRVLASRIEPLIHRTVGMSALSSMLMRPSVQSYFRRFPLLRRLYGDGWHFLHPMDRRYGTDTSGTAPAPRIDGEPLFYAPSQPCVIRAALQALPTVDGFTFIDLGCGKGRALLVAAEFPFREICGIDFSADLVTIARRNVARVRTRYTDRKQAQVYVGDARSYEYPPGDLVVYMYNPFGALVVREVIRKLEVLLDEAPRRIFVVYCNPVQGHCIDDSPRFRRYFAAMVPYAPEEAGYGPNAGDCVVIWYAGPDNLAPLPGSESQIRLVHGGQAELVLQQRA